MNMHKVEGMCEYLAVYETSAKYYVVMERVKGMDLFEHMQLWKFQQEDAREILFQMLKALRAMHALGRIHRDLKDANVVVDLSSTKMPRVSSNGSTTCVEANLIDLDTAEYWDPTGPKTKQVVGTDGYIAPEAYFGNYSPASDIFFVGVIMYKLLTGKLPFMFPGAKGEWSATRMQECLKEENVDFELPPLNSMPVAQVLVKQMMVFDLEERPSASEALKHPWFQHSGRGSSLVSSISTSAGRRSSVCSASSSSTQPWGSPSLLPGEPEELYWRKAFGCG